jgi:hypothetical protein
MRKTWVTGETAETSFFNAAHLIARESGILVENTVNAAVTGLAAALTLPVSFVKFENGVVIISFPGFTGTSNSTALAITGVLPDEVLPIATGLQGSPSGHVGMDVIVIDDGIHCSGRFYVGETGAMQWGRTAVDNGRITTGNNFLATGVKGCRTSVCMYLSHPQAV